eukprot:jgi/Chlat1/2569/Chrsp175S02414
MNFLRSFQSVILGEDLVPDASRREEKSPDSDNQQDKDGASSSVPVPEGEAVAEQALFGTLAKAVTELTVKAQHKSEEMLAQYQKDIIEFGRELQREGKSVVEKTSTKLPQLPNILENQAVTAQEQVEAMGRGLETFGSSVFRGTTEIFQQVREAVAMETEFKAKKTRPARPDRPVYAVSGKYSRMHAEVSAMQRDSSTYCDEPEDAADYAAWKEAFRMEDKQADIEGVLKDNAFMQELQTRIVPLIVERETFWMRYFYRLYKLQQAQEARNELMKRATVSEEDELSWDVDDAEGEPQELPKDLNTTSQPTAQVATEPVQEEPSPSATLVGPKTTGIAPVVYTPETTSAPASKPESPVAQPEVTVELPNAQLSDAEATPKQQSPIAVPEADPGFTTEVTVELPSAQPAAPVTTPKQQSPVAVPEADPVFTTLEEEISDAAAPVDEEPAIESPAPAVHKEDVEPALATPKQVPATPAAEPHGAEHAVDDDTDDLFATDELHDNKSDGSAASGASGWCVVASDEKSSPEESPAPESAGVATKKEASVAAEQKTPRAKKQGDDGEEDEGWGDWE